jgi:hypothetical protein
MRAPSTGTRIADSFARWDLIWPVPMQSAVAESWGVPTNAGAYDPLLASLVHVTGLLGRPWSAEALSAGSYYLFRVRTSQGGRGAGGAKPEGHPRDAGDR